MWDFDLWEWVLGRGGAVAAWGLGCGWVLINQRSLSTSKSKQSKKYIQNLKIFQQWQQLMAWGFQFGVGDYGFVLNCILGCGGCGGYVVVAVGCWQQCLSCKYYFNVYEILF